MTLIHLFFIFFYIGLFAVGGGLVAATFMYQALVDKYALISAEKFYSMLAISESTPGPIGINLATYLGTELFGIPGAIICTLGEVMPAIIIIMVVARFFTRFQDKTLVQAGFEFLRPATSGLVLVALVQVFVIALLNISGFKASFDIKDLFVWPAVSLYLICLAVLFKTKLHPVFIVVLGAVFGILFL